MNELEKLKLENELLKKELSLLRGDLNSIKVCYGKNLVGTCGSCGGPVLQDIVHTIGLPPPLKICGRCGRFARSLRETTPIYGPILDME